MDTDLLKTFLEVSKTRHFGKAADNLFVTQAAVSARIKQLEKMLGASLLVRSRNNIHLTAEGERLVPYAETIMLSLSQAKQSIALQQASRQQITLGATSGMWHFYLQECLTRIYDEASGIALRALAKPERELRSMLIDGTLDLALVYEPIQDSRFEHVRLGGVKLVLASTLESPSLEEALTENYTMVDWGTFFESFHAKVFYDAQPPKLLTNMASIAAFYIRQSGGSAYLPEADVARQNSKLRVVEDAPVFFRDVYAAFHMTAEKKPLLKSILKCMDELSDRLDKRAV